MHSLVCERCGAGFEARIRTRRFCGRSCAAKVTNAGQRAAGQVLGRKANGVTVACEICGQSVYRKLWQEKKGHGRFCSQACHTVWQARNSIERPCEWCGKSMQMSPFRAGLQRFCCRACMLEGISSTAIERWHNGRRVRKNADGYLMVYQPDHASAYKDGWMPEHRLVAEQMVGRPLTPDEHVHHISGQKDENAPENLVVLSASEHQAITMRSYLDKVAQDREDMAAARARLAAYEARFGPLPEEV